MIFFSCDNVEYFSLSGTWTLWTNTRFCSWYCWTGWLVNTSNLYYLEWLHVFSWRISWCNMQDKANPLATVLSVAMLLKYGLGEENAAKRIEAAVLDTLSRGYRTGDIYSAGNVCTFFLLYILSVHFHFLVEA